LSSPHSPLEPSQNGSGPRAPGGPPPAGRSLWDRYPRLSCVGLVAIVFIAGLAVFIVGLTHPLIIIAIGLVLVGVCGLGLLITKD
jgi:hypothetical protein